MATYQDAFGARATLESAHGAISYYRLAALTKHGVQGLERLPLTVKIILENLLRHADGELLQCACANIECDVHQAHYPLRWAAWNNSRHSQ